MNNLPDVSAPSHPRTTDNGTEPAAEECRSGAPGLASPPTPQRAAVPEKEPAPSTFVFSALILLTEDLEQEGVMHVAAVHEASGLCWTLGVFHWWGFPQLCPASMTANVVDVLLDVVPSGKITLTTSEPILINYESVAFIAEMLDLYLPGQEVVADQLWLDPRMEGEGAVYASPVCELVDNVHSTWDEAPHGVSNLENRLLARQGYEAVARRALAAVS